MAKNWQEKPQLNRTYQADFEIFESASQQGGRSEVAIYLGVK